MPPDTTPEQSASVDPDDGAGSEAGASEANADGGAGIDVLSYEEAREELIAIVATIESGDVPLEESMRLWERGEALAAHCQAKLDAAQEQLDKTTAEEYAGEN